MSTHRFGKASPTISRRAFAAKLRSQRCVPMCSEDPEMKDLIEYLDSLKNYEKSCVNKGEGTDSGDGFDLGRMKRLMHRLGVTFPGRKVAFVVAMACDKHRFAFAKELLSGQRPEAALLTEADIAGAKTRATSSSSLRDTWIKAADQLGICSTVLLNNDDTDCLTRASKATTTLRAESSLQIALRLAYKILNESYGSGIIVVTGSLHIVSLVLASVQT